METYNYDFLNIYNAQSPTGIHAANTTLTQYFRRYLFQKAISVFEWDLPKNWSSDYFLYVLYGLGFIGILNIKGFGTIPQRCAVTGYNIFYQPSKMIVTNPVLTQTQERIIGKDSALIKLTPDFRGIDDIVQIYADMMAVCWEDAGVNVKNSMLAYVFAGKSKTFSESFKKMFDQMSSGKPAVFIDKELMGPNGEPMWMTFANNLKQNFIAPDLFAAIDKVENMFCQEVGIPNMGSIEKKERLVTDEVNKNTQSTYSKARLWLESIQRGIDTAREIFPDLEMNVKMREEGDGNESNIEHDGSL